MTRPGWESVGNARLAIRIRTADPALTDRPRSAAGTVIDLGRGASLTVRS